MKKVLFGLSLLTGFIVQAQVYNNEWISDYNKTYYKFKVGKTGLYRIQQPTLAAAGLGATPAQHFQLFRNGKEIPIYTSAASGALSGSDYIEFWGEMNDGKPDKELYRLPDYQLNDKWSLETDTATYFLTINTGVNLRLQTTANNVAANTLPAEPYFMHKASRYFRDKMNPGYAVNVGEYLYSSAYDKGEGWSSTDIGPGGTNSFTFNNLFVNTSGPAPSVSVGVSGNAINTRKYRLKINGDSVVGNSVDFFTFLKDGAGFSNTTISSGTAVVEVTNLSPFANDRMVVHQYEITYARQFNFGGANNFEFKLPAGISGNYLEISGFNYGSSVPVLYDVTNGKRYAADISTLSLLKIALAPSSVERNLVLVSEEAGNVSFINSLQSRTFINYALAQNQGNFLIISNPLLFNGANGNNPVEDYRAYRSSVEGGSNNAKVYLIGDLVDQFAFGIKMHPAAVRNFLLFARQNFTITPKHVFLIGKGIHYLHQRSFESDPNLEKLHFVPTFGWPASDVLLSADPGDAIPQIPIGRLSVINGQEVDLYLKKIKEYELAQRTASPFIKDKAWMKNVAHVVGASEPALQISLDNYMQSYKSIISDTFYGAKVTTFTKSSPEAVEQLNNGEMDKLFAEGMSLITYFGHSSAGTLEFNLNTPDQYNNQGKYPVFVALGCNAGNFYNFNTARFSAKETLSEKYVLAPDRGTIGFIASSHFGIVHYLDVANSRTYTSLSQKDYGKSIGEIFKSTIIETFAFTTQDDFYARAQSEETSLHGDPSITLNTHAKPDYVIEDPLVKINPSFVSVADASFNIIAKFLNIGKAINDNIVVQVRREYPNRSSQVIYKDTIPGIRFADSININVPIDPTRDKGSNKLTITIDAENNVEELFETNNSVVKEIFVFEDEARPVYPYNLSIVNKQNIKLVASTANPLSAVKTYRMEIDTTEKFNSPLKAISTLTSGGGVLEFAPGVSFIDSTVYYWRIAPVITGEMNWNSSSFIYIAGTEAGFNQSHVYQHFLSTPNGLSIDSLAQWKFATSPNNLFMRNAVFPTAGGQAVDFSVAVNGDAYVRSVCGVSGILVHVFDPKTFLPWKNASGGQPGLYGSDFVCGDTRIYNFQYNILDVQKRQALVNLLNLIPSGHFVVVKNISGTDPASNTYPDQWKADTAMFGSNNSIYHHLFNQGFNEIDSFNRPRAWLFTYKKDDPSFVPKYTFSEGIYDKITLSAEYRIPGSTGYITSPVFGPAKSWNTVFLQGAASEASTGDEAKFDVIGIKANGSIDTLYNNLDLTQPSADISAIDATIYPYLQLHMTNKDGVHFTPYQLKSWRITYTPVPEGSVAANLYYSPLRDSLELGESTGFKIAFKNVSDLSFDSLKVKVVLTDANNVAHILLEERRKPLAPGDTLRLEFPIDSRKYAGVNSLLVDFNPDNDQPEQYRFNNFVYQNLYVRGDTLNPLLDVTFDNTHILNGDIVSSRPDILIKLKDEAKYLFLDDTSLVKIQVKYPNGSLRNFNFNNDTLRFTPAGQAPGSENTATINFNPYFEEDGDYELIVSGKDKSNNLAGSLEYRVGFQVINKAMISNMLNYPNPFTTSTAFVFTITGAEVPQNLKIQILTVTGKIVREITKDELGPLRVGRNITEFKWNGTDQYGQKLGNGVYLYRVITNLNGKSLEKYTSENDNTDKYFNKGYGKMYLMR